MSAFSQKRTYVLQKELAYWSLTTSWEKLFKIGANVVRHGCYVNFQLAGLFIAN